MARTRRNRVLDRDVPPEDRPYVCIEFSDGTVERCSTHPDPARVQQLLADEVAQYLPVTAVRFLYLPVAVAPRADDPYELERARQRAEHLAAWERQQALLTPEERARQQEREEAEREKLARLVREEIAQLRAAVREAKLENARRRGLTLD